jgi:hypothetical protein
MLQSAGVPPGHRHASARCAQPGLRSQSIGFSTDLRRRNLKLSANIVHQDYDPHLFWQNEAKNCSNFKGPGSTMRGRHHPHRGRLPALLEQVCCEALHRGAMHWTQLPKLLGDRKWRDLHVRPPIRFFATLVRRLMSHLRRCSTSAKRGQRQVHRREWRWRRSAPPQAARLGYQAFRAFGLKAQKGATHVHGRRCQGIC